VCLSRLECSWSSRNSDRPQAQSGARDGLRTGAASCPGSQQFGHGGWGVPRGRTIAQGPTVPADPGKSNSSGVRACLDKWIASKQTVLIPIYDLVTGNQNNATYRIVGIAAFVLTSRDQPAVDNIRGYFVQFYPYTNPVPGGAGSGVPQPGDSSYFLGLVK
jgi:hypothetical protein